MGGAAGAGTGGSVAAGTGGAGGSGGEPTAGAGGASGGTTGGATGGSSGGSAGTGGGAGGPSVDCSLAGTVPVTVTWNAINSQPADWYGSAEALTVADNVVYYQNVDGGWPKAVDMTQRVDPKDGSTIDNRATTTQIQFLSRVYSASGCSKYGDAAVTGINALLDAQYPSGGWPQTFPNPTGYHAHITFNDDAMAHVLTLLRSVSRRDAPYSFADDALAAEAGAAVESGIECILQCQVVLDGQKAGWCAQHDEVTPRTGAGAHLRAPSLSGSEGAGLLEFLMTVENPSAEVKEAVQGAAAWFEAVKLTGIKVVETVAPEESTGEDRVVVEDASAPPIWARFYELETNKPIFSSRCEVPECASDPFYMRRYSLAEIENERRVGYSWYGDWPADALAAYPAWAAKWQP